MFLKREKMRPLAKTASLVLGWILTEKSLASKGRRFLTFYKPLIETPLSLGFGKISIYIKF